MAALFHDLLDPERILGLSLRLRGASAQLAFDRAAEGSVVMGMPAILVYIASIWLILILALYLFDRGNFD